SDSQTNASSMAMPAATARASSRAPSIRNRCCLWLCRAERKRMASLTRGLCGLVMMRYTIAAQSLYRFSFVIGSALSPAQARPARQSRAAGRDKIHGGGVGPGFSRVADSMAHVAEQTVGGGQFATMAREQHELR